MTLKLLKISILVLNVVTMGSVFAQEPNSTANYTKSGSQGSSLKNWH
jgi:hypothetical protein